jgi:hypothetical protein
MVEHIGIEEPLQEALFCKRATKLLKPLRVAIA